MKNHYIKTILSGRSMIEMLGVLAIVGILSAGGIAGYSMAMQSYKTKALIEKIQTIALAARNVYKGKYTELTADNLISSGRISDMKNPFGGNLAITPDVSSFTIYTEGFNIPTEACSDVMTADWGKEGVFVSVKVGGQGTFSYANGTYPLTIAKAISICKSGNGRIVLTFK